MVLGLLLGCGSGLFPQSLLANVPGGGTNGANVTLTDNGSTVTLANGIVSIVCTKSGATINHINYTYNNGGGSRPNSCSPAAPTAASCIGKTATMRGWLHLLARRQSHQQRRQLCGNRHAHHLGDRRPRWRCIFQCCAARPVFTPRRSTAMRAPTAALLAWANAATTFTPGPCSTG